MTCIIVDDEPLAVKLLESFVARTPQLELKGSYTDSVEAVAALRQTPVDLVFLDIQMPDMDGMELARTISHSPQPAHRSPLIIFTTAFKEYAFDSYEVSAVDFLLKPIRYNKFLTAVEKAEQRLTTASPSSLEEEVTTLVFSKIFDVLHANLENPEYAAAEDVIVHYGLMDEEKNLYGVSEEDGQKLGEKLFSSEGLE